MHWLAPMTAIYAAAASIPLLVLLYFLKLKRREQPVSSTFLWKRAVQDLQVNAPFQKLRRNLLLLLQLLMLLALLAALGRPVVSLTAGPAKRYVLLIDRSASMNCTDADGPRLEAARRQAKVLAESMRSRTGFGLGDESDQAMVIAFAERAKVLCNFTSDKRKVLAAIDAVTPSDGRSCLAEAITVARAFAQSSPEGGDIQAGTPAAQLELFSDGRISDLDQIVVAGGELNFHRVGKARDNIAVVAMQARRSYERAEEVAAFASLANYAPRGAACDVQFSVDGNVRAVRRVTMPPAKPPEGTQPAKPGTVSISYTLTHAAAGVVEVRQLRGDVLACDDAAWAILEPPRKLRVLLVTAGSPALSAALAACPVEILETKTPEEFDSLDHAAMGARQPYDVIVLDGRAPRDLPRGRYLIFGRPPEPLGAAAVEKLTNQVVVDWRARHPVLQFVDLTDFFAAACWKLKLPRDAEVLAEFAESPAMALVRRKGSVFLLAGFDPMDTTWPFEPAFVMFCYNAMNFLGLEATTGRERSLAVGEAIYVEGLPPAAKAKIERPGPADAEADCDQSGTLRYPDTNLAGLYTVTIGDGAPLRYAVNLLDADESYVAPADEIVLSGRKVEAAAGPPQPANIELWPYLVALALIVACLEWFVYNSRVRL